MQCSHVDVLKKASEGEGVLRGFEWKIPCTWGDDYAQLPALGPNLTIHPPLAGGLVLDAFKVQTLCSAMGPQREGELDSEMHALVQPTASHHSKCQCQA